MILQLQVERRDVGADDYLQTLTPEEKRQIQRQIHEAREMKRMTRRPQRYGDLSLLR